eukprot:GFUD01010651.1.p1 GENE.GFUD01010651.1~~GFUD01010651.1.p1  ORF type:complete len:755 (-),score=140.96 GFUD01010651.1:213-2477(-)
MDSPVNYEPPQDVPSSYLLKCEPSQDVQDDLFIKREVSSISQCATIVKVFNCGLCEYSTNDKSNFKRHKQFKHKLPVLEPFALKDYCCTECDYNSSNKSNFNRHMASKHKDVEVKLETKESDILNIETSDTAFSEIEDKMLCTSLFIPCQFCEFKTKWSSNMIKHIKSKHGEVNVGFSVVKKCKYCPFVGSCRKELRLHKKIEHKEILKVFNCNICTYTSNWEDSMKLHNKFHGVMKEYPGVECDHCDFIYKYNPLDQKGLRKCKQTLNEHMNDEHAEVKFKCDQCDKTFWTPKQLELHKITHNYSSAEGSYSCDQCEYKCYKSNTLKLHINAVHLGVKPHLCELCPAAFASKSSLNNHKLSHSDERNFKCQFCEKAFHSKGNLETHIRTHTGEKPYTCDVCGKSFSDQAYFAKHKRLHDTNSSGQSVKDFICQICSKGFNRRPYLRSHMTSHLNQVEGKATKFSNEFKMEAVLKAKNLGVTKAATEMCVNMKTLKNWVKLSVHPHICSLCGKAFSYEAQLKNHFLTHPADDSQVKANIRYKTAFKLEVSQYALNQSIQEAVIKYQLPHSTINFWVKRMSNPQPCHLCGKSFSNDSSVRRHIEQVHKDTPEGLEEQSRRAAEIQISQPFSEFLADNDLLPSEEQIQERTREKEKKKEEKEEFALLAREILSREKGMKDKELEMGQFGIPFQVKTEEAEEFKIDVLAPITCLTVCSSNDQESGFSESFNTDKDQESELSGTVKIEPNHLEVFPDN